MAILMELDKKKPIKMAGGWLELNERDDSLSHMMEMIFSIPQLGRPKMQCLASIMNPSTQNSANFTSRWVGLRFTTEVQ